MRTQPPCLGLVPVSLAILLSVGMVSACGEGAGAGAPCTSHGQCADSYQCQAEVCVPRCAFNNECGDGYQCSPSGICNAVVSSIGDACASEWQCGPGQRCILNEADVENTGVLSATCQPQGAGSGEVVGAECGLDLDCRSGLCSLGHCSLLCETNGDCPIGTGCEDIPRILEGDSAIFHGCLQSTGVLSTEIFMDSPSARLRIPVPSSAQSFAVVTSVQDPNHRVGATRVVSPTGKLLFNGATVLEDLIDNDIRYIRQTQLSTLFVPNGVPLNDDFELETGIYQIDVEASLPPFGPGNAIPEVTVFYKLDTSRILDLHFYFLNLDEHPCRENFGIDILDATTAPAATQFQNEYLRDLKAILTAADITPGVITYTDIERADLDGIVEGDFDDLFQLADNESGIAIFFARSLSPDGVQTRVGGTPGPPRSPHTVASGIALSADTLCYRSWEAMARVTAHSIGAQMGLWNNRDPEGTLDPIADSDSSPANLMFFGEFGGTELSDGQKKVLGRYPGLN